MQGVIQERAPLSALSDKFMPGLSEITFEQFVFRICA